MVLGKGKNESNACHWKDTTCIHSYANDERLKHTPWKQRDDKIMREVVSELKRVAERPKHGLTSSLHQWGDFQEHRGSNTA